MRADSVVLGNAEELAHVRLTGFLREQARRPFVWGACDCCLFLADWIAHRDGLDPAADLRGTYSTEREMRNLLKAKGGIFNVVGSCAERAGLQRIGTAQPRPGDVGLVNVCIKLWRGRGVLVPVGAILVSPSLWAIRPRERGVCINQFPVVMAWTQRHG